MFKVIIAFCTMDGANCTYLALPPRFRTEFECSTYQIDYITSGRADAKAIELGKRSVNAICLSEPELVEMGLEIQK